MNIAIIGAGLAGMTAASRLVAAGHRVDVLEKSRGAGGRMGTRREAWASLDLGAQYFTARSPEFRAEIGGWTAAGLAARWAVTPHRVEGGKLRLSPDATHRYVGLPGMNAPLRTLGNGAGLHTQTLVEGLEQRRDGWRLRTAAPLRVDGYDWVISSLPAEQARELLSDNRLAERIPARVHTPCWAVALATSGPVAEPVQAIFGDDVISWAARQSGKPGRAAPTDCDDAWVLHFTPQWSLEHGKETDLDPAAVAADWLQSRLGTTLAVRHRYRHYWRYANAAGAGLDTPYLVDSEQRLAIIGAWCLGGKVEDAFRSGLALAERLCDPPGLTTSERCANNEFDPT